MHARLGRTALGIVSLLNTPTCMHTHGGLSLRGEDWPDAENLRRTQTYSLSFGMFPPKESRLDTENDPPPQRCSCSSPKRRPPEARNEPPPFPSYTHTSRKTIDAESDTTLPAHTLTLAHTHSTHAHSHTHSHLRAVCHLKRRTHVCRRALNEMGCGEWW